MNRVRGWVSTRWALPLALFGLLLLSEGVWIPWQGLFGNDVSYLWFYHLLGPWGPGAFAALDRPFSAVFYAASTFLLGERVWAYHLELLLLRWVSALLVAWVLRLVWPDQRRAAGLAAVLFAVYPGFRQTPIALEFILHFFVLDVFLLSLGATLRSIETAPRQGLWRIVSVISAAGVFLLEYFIGLEILRPIFLWILTRRQGLRGKAQVRRILAAWLPTLLVVLVFLIWRVLIFSFPTYRPVLLDALRVHPLTALMGLAQTALRDLWTASGAAWLQTLRLPSPGGMRYVTLALMAASLLWLGAFAWNAWHSVDTADPAQERRLGLGWLGLGLLLMLTGGSIFWLTSIPITLTFPWDRSTLALAPGAVLALTGLLKALLSPRGQMAVVVLLAALAVGLHFQNGLEYRAEWQKLRNFTWELTWRAPGLRPGTLLLFDVIPLNRYSDNDLSALLNWTYAPAWSSRAVPYNFFDLTIRMGEGYAGLPGVQKDLPVFHDQRGVTFTSSTSQMVALIYNPPACLKILAPEDALLPGIPERIARVLPITQPGQIIDARYGAHPPAPLGAEPAHGWCYYFERADLAVQMGRWQDAAALADQAAQAGLRPSDQAELLPIVEAYARVGRPAEAQALTFQAAARADLQPALCAAWLRSDHAPPPALGCP